MMSSQDLIHSLQACLSRHFSKPVEIASLSSRPCPRASSYSLQQLEVIFTDGSSIKLLMKELAGRSMLKSASSVKPQFLINPHREIEAYRMLAGKTLGTPLCYGWEDDSQAPVQRIFLEWVEGRELYEVGEFELWEEAALWLARFHRRFAADSPSEQLLRMDTDWYRLWFGRATEFLKESSHLSEAEQQAWSRLAEGWEGIAARLAALPSTFIHGEFYPSNILIRSRAAAARVCPLDWEMAAWGPGLIDLAALTSGSWRPEQRQRLAQAYWSEAEPGCWDRLWEDLEHCRLANAVQWLGWSPRWTPPPEHRQDWLSEALLAFEALKRMQGSGGRSP